MFPIARFQLTPVARKAAFACASLAALAALPGQAEAFTESGDAGQTQATAQVTTGVGALTDIVGALASATDADLYLIQITSPGSFSASTVNATGGFLDTQLFLFTLAGAPVFMNDDDAGGQSVLSTLGSGSSFGPVSAGFYLLGVSMSGYDPVNINGQTLFAAGLPTTLRGPASGLQPALLGGFFDGTYYADSGAYDIVLTGAAVAAAVPEPASALLFAIGGVLGAAAALRRRRTAA